MLENKETALIVKAKLERLREKLQDVWDSEDAGALEHIWVTKGTNGSGDDIHHNVHELLEGVIDEIDFKIKLITKKHLL